MVAPRSTSPVTSGRRLHDTTTDADGEDALFGQIFAVTSTGSKWLSINVTDPNMGSMSRTEGFELWKFTTPLIAGEDPANISVKRRLSSSVAPTAALAVATFCRPVNVVIFEPLELSSSKLFNAEKVTAGSPTIRMVVGVTDSYWFPAPNTA